MNRFRYLGATCLAITLATCYCLPSSASTTENTSSPSFIEFSPDSGFLPRGILFEKNTKSLILFDGYVGDEEHYFEDSKNIFGYNYTARITILRADSNYDQPLRVDPFQTFEVKKVTSTSDDCQHLVIRSAEISNLMICGCTSKMFTRDYLGKQLLDFAVLGHRRVDTWEEEKDYTRYPGPAKSVSCDYKKHLPAGLISVLSEPESENQ